MSAFTAAQNECIISRNENLLVSAGAGSGKTTVLSERIASLISEGACSADEILVVTFTRAAAGEMKERIRKKLTERFLDAENPAYLASEIKKLDRAQISTIHSFCMDLIRQYYYVIGVDPSFRLSDEDETDVMLAKTIGDFFAEAYNSGDAEFALLEDSYSGGSESEVLKEGIISAYKFSLSYPQGASLFSELAEAYPTEPEKLAELPFAVDLAAQLGKKVVAALESLHEAIRLVNEYDPDEKKLANLSELQGYFAQMNECIVANDLEGFFDILQTASPGRWSFRKQVPFAEEVKALRASAADAVRTLRKNYPFNGMTYLSHMRVLTQTIKKYSACVAEFASLVEEEKKARKIFTFSDLEHLALKILGNDEAASSIRQSYRYVFVDEYQDVNAIQERIISLVSPENAFFAVGDIKQSIYGFRGSDATIFNKRKNAYQNGEGGRLIRLQENFRSNRCVINAVNALFSKIMFSETSIVDYLPDEALISGLPDERKEGAATLIVIDKKNSSGSGKALSDAETEAAFIAEAIEKLLKTRIYDEALGGERFVCPGDICVIGRSMNGFSSVLGSALRKKGISSQSDGDERYLDLTEIALLVNILKLTDNARDDIALVSVMNSPLYGFTCDELVEIRLFAKNKRFFYECALAYQSEVKDTEAARKLKALYSDIEAFRYTARYDSLENTIRAVFKRTRIKQIFAAFPDGARRIENMDYLIEVASNYENGNIADLREFIAFIEKLQGTRSFASRSKAALRENSVSILTTHKSKGLEFNIVFLRGISKTFNREDTRGDVLFSAKYGICLGYRDIEKNYRCDSLIKSFFVSETKKETASEEMRLLYVAATRAKKQLYLTMVADSEKAEKLFDEELSIDNIISASGYFSWVAPAVKQSECWSVVGGDAFLSVTEEHSQSEIDVKNPVYDEFVALGEKAPENKAEELSKRIMYIYPHEADLSVPTKMSVTQLEDENLLFVGSRTVELKALPDFSGRSALSAVEAGTLTHRFLERFDPAAYHGESEAFVETEMQRLIKMGVFLAEEAKSINTDYIIRFFSREAGKTLLAHLDTVKRETPFIMSVPAAFVDEGFSKSTRNIVVQGMIDCYYEEEDGYTIFDYKTDRFKNKTDQEARLARYTRQIKLYARALEKNGGKIVKKSYICFLNEEFEKII